METDKQEHGYQQPMSMDGVPKGCPLNMDDVNENLQEKSHDEYVQPYFVDKEGINTRKKSTIDTKQITTTIGKLFDVICYVCADVWPNKNKIYTSRRAREKLFEINWGMLYDDDLCNAKIIAGKNKGNRCRYKAKEERTHFCNIHFKRYMQDHTKVEIFDGHFGRNANDKHEMFYRRSKERRDHIEHINPFEFADKSIDDKLSIMMKNMEDMAQAIKNQVQDIIAINRKFKRLEKKGVIPPEYTREDDNNITMCEQQRLIDAGKGDDLIVEDGTDETKLKINKIKYPDGKEAVKQMLEIFPEKDKWTKENKRICDELDERRAQRDKEEKEVSESLNITRREAKVDLEGVKEVKSDNNKFYIDVSTIRTVQVEEPKGEMPTNIDYSDIPNPIHRRREELSTKMGLNNIMPDTKNEMFPTEIKLMLLSPDSDRINQRYFIKRAVSFEEDDAEESDIEYSKFWRDFYTTMLRFKGMTEEGELEPFASTYRVVKSKIDSINMIYGKRPTVKNFQSLVTDMREVKDMMKETNYRINDWLNDNNMML